MDAYVSSSGVDLDRSDSGTPMSRLRSNAFQPAHEDRQEERQQSKPSHLYQGHQGGYQAPHGAYASMGSSEAPESRSLSKLGWKVVAGLAVLGVFLLLSKGRDLEGGTYLKSPSPSYRKASSLFASVIAECQAAGIHPIACKVEHAAELAQQLVDRQSRTIADAVLAYEERYKRKPPPRFEEWVALALHHNSTIIDDYDQIHLDIDFFRQSGLVGDKLRARILEAKLAEPGLDLGQITIIDGHAAVLGPDSGPISATSLLEILEPVRHIIPDLTVPFSWVAEPKVPHPSPSSSAEPLTVAVESGQDSAPFLLAGCPSNHLAPTRAWDSLLPPLDFCHEDFEEIAPLHGFLQSPVSFKPVSKLVPIISRSKLSNFADILAPNVCYGGGVYRGTPDTVAWKDKSDDLYWRGATTGKVPRAHDWAQGHRHRFVRYAKQLREAANKLATGKEVDPFDAIYSPDSPKLTTSESLHDGGNTLPLFEYSHEPVVEAVKRLGASKFNVLWYLFLEAEEKVTASYMDNYFRTPEEPRDEIHKHKFLLDIDGESMSCRYYELLSSNSVVFKQTIWYEWHDDRLIPWIHYVPLDLRVENDDLPLMLDFFINHPQGPETAAKIAAESKKWAEATLRPIDVALYFARTLIEYSTIYFPSV